MNILLKLLTWAGSIGRAVVDSKDEGEEANPFSVKVARWTTVAAAIGVVGVIFPIVWSTPPWWVEHNHPKIQPMMAESSAVEKTTSSAPAAAMSVAPEETISIPYVILGVLVSLMLVSTIIEIWARRSHRAKRRSHSELRDSVN